MLVTLNFSLFYIGDEKNFEYSFNIPQEFVFLFVQPFPVAENF